jgi:ribosomal protein L19E
MGKFVDAYNQLKLNQEDINQLNRLITSNEIEAVIKSFPIKKSKDLMDSQLNFNKPLEKK